VPWPKLSAVVVSVVTKFWPIDDAGRAIPIGIHVVITANAAVHDRDPNARAVPTAGVGKISVHRTHYVIERASYRAIRRNVRYIRVVRQGGQSFNRNGIVAALIKSNLVFRVPPLPCTF